MISISVTNIGKCYRRYDADRPWTLQETVLSGFRGLRSRDYFWSLRNITFQLERGRALGVLGRNGAGKSTLLRLISGIGKPNEGRLVVNGKLGGLLELTAGFHSDLTGRENAIIGGVLRGLTRSEVMDRFESILDFSELRDFIDRPLRTYSTGMQMRLAFAVAIHAEPDVMLVDEVLAVGDVPFQRKCLDKIRQLRMNGSTLVLVSHDPSLIRDMCDDALWLQEGRMKAYGPASEVVRDYVGSFENETLRKTAVDLPPIVTSQGVVLRMGENRFGSLEVRFTDIRLHTDTDPSGLELTTGDCLTVEAEYTSDQPVDDPVFGVSIIRMDGSTYFSTSTDQTKLEIPRVTRGHITLKIERIEFDPGTYFVDIGVYQKNWQFAYDYHARTYPIVVRHKGLTIPVPREQPGVPHVHWIFNTTVIETTQS